MRKLIIIFKVRFKALSNILIILLLLSLLNIILIEFFLKKYPATLHWHEALGAILLQLSYAFLTTFIFYYIVNFEPQVRRKISAHRILNNDLLKIDDYIDNLISVIIKNSSSNITNPEINENNIKLACVNINPLLPIKILNSNGSIKEFKNFYNFAFYQVEKIQYLLYTLITLNELIDDQIIIKIYDIKDELNFLIYDEHKIPNNKDLNFLSYIFIELHFLSKELNNDYMKIHGIYDWEYHYNKRKIHKERMSKIV